MCPRDMNQRELVFDGSLIGIVGPDRHQHCFGRLKVFSIGGSGSRHKDALWEALCVGRMHKRARSIEPVR